MNNSSSPEYACTVDAPMRRLVVNNTPKKKKRRRRKRTGKEIRNEKKMGMILK